MGEIIGDHSEQLVGGLGRDYRDVSNQSMKDFDLTIQFWGLGGNRDVSNQSMIDFGSDIQFWGLEGIGMLAIYISVIAFDLTIQC